MNLHRLSYFTRQTLISGLEHLSASPDNVPDKGFGICWNLQEVAFGGYGSEAYELVSIHSIGWPSRTGKVDVGGAGCSYPIRRTRNTPLGTPLWEGEQLAQRLSLMAHLLKLLKAA